MTDTSKKPRDFNIKVESDGTINRLYFNKFNSPNHFDEVEYLRVIEHSEYSRVVYELEKSQSDHIKKYQSLLEQCEKLAEALEFIAKDETPELSDSTNYVSALQIARQTLQEFKKFKGEA